MMEFHVSRQARDRYQFDQVLFALNGNVLLADFHAARVFAQKMNQKKDLVRFPDQAVKAGQINAMGLLDEILHHVIAQYRRQKNAEVMSQALGWLEEAVGVDALDKLIVLFMAEFPPVAVYQGKLSVETYLQLETDGISNRALALEELVLLWVTNQNPACQRYAELFDDELLQRETVYPQAMQALYTFFETQPRFGPDHQNLIDMLCAPARAFPDSLEDQLEFVRRSWSGMLGSYLTRLLSSLDLIKEEEKAVFFGPGPVAIPVYDSASVTAGELEAENFSLDREWMPRLVLIAKNTYVWLDQLSKQYGRSITRLDQIPDEELDLLAQRGFSGLWLIGLWERSRASARVKQLCGNPEAVASAYSLASYQIAAEIGGEDAYRNLRDRAWQRGIRLASDMVPNHMGIDSDWVIEHPEWFLSLDYSPFPSYTFNGPDLAPDGRVSLYLEDHYYSRSDAAVVFKRVDHRNGGAQYIYHGNDGTSMPWNDTAQLNYLNPQVREAVIQTILSVARRFPIIRFDAAMTLAKRHYQRLWFPEPGSGGDIPTRAEHGMTRQQFDEALPEEFWREVVDRVAQEAPDTLLLAEAFWLMESYFVRTLGMHRVYNSAFMNLLRNEDNGKYRQLMKNTLEFDPEILKRFVNFMNNPDERTAVDQFGKGDKYFGICILMCTLPGLPMFGHGQVEGLAEKYGMEFRRAYWDEQSDVNLVQRHQREVFPLLHRRQLFANVDHFLLYDFFAANGPVNEDVYAYSNGAGSERALVVYHNRFGSAHGWVRMSVGYLWRDPQGERQIVQRSLGEGLNLHPEAGRYVIYRDQVTGLEHIAASQDVCERGLYFDLHAYQYHVFLDFREVQDDEWNSYRQLCSYLNGRGVPSIRHALRDLLLQPVLTPLQQLVNPGYWGYLLDNRLSDERPALPPGLLTEAEHKLTGLLKGIIFMTDSPADWEALLARRAGRWLRAVLELPHLERLNPLPGAKHYPAGLTYLQAELHRPENWLALFEFAFVHELGRLAKPDDFIEQTLAWWDEWQLSTRLVEVAQTMGLAPEAAVRAAQVVRVLISQQRWFASLGKLPAEQVLEGWLADEAVQRFLGVNRYQDVLWFNHESFEQFVWWMMLLHVLDVCADEQGSASQVVEVVLADYELVQRLLQAEQQANYQVVRLLEAVRD